MPQNVQAVFLLPMFFLGILSLGVMVFACASKAMAGTFVRAPQLVQQIEAVLFSGQEVEVRQAQENLEDMM